MTRRQIKEHKLGNAVRAYYRAKRGYLGGMGFNFTQTGRALILRVKRWQERLGL